MSKTAKPPENDIKSSIPHNSKEIRTIYNKYKLSIGSVAFKILTRSIPAYTGWINRKLIDDSLKFIDGGRHPESRQLLSETLDRCSLVVVDDRTNRKIVVDGRRRAANLFAQNAPEAPAQFVYWHDLVEAGLLTEIDKANAGEAALHELSKSYPVNVGVGARQGGGTETVEIDTPAIGGKGRKPRTDDHLTVFSYFVVLYNILILRAKTDKAHQDINSTIYTISATFGEAKYEPNIIITPESAKSEYKQAKEYIKFLSKNRYGNEEKLLNELNSLDDKKLTTMLTLLSRVTSSADQFKQYARSHKRTYTQKLNKTNFVKRNHDFSIFGAKSKIDIRSMAELSHFSGINVSNFYPEEARSYEIVEWFMLIDPLTKEINIRKITSSMAVEYVWWYETCTKHRYGTEELKANNLAMTWALLFHIIETNQYTKFGEPIKGTLDCRLIYIFCISLIEKASKITE